MYIGWKGPLNDNSSILLGDVYVFLVLWFSLYKGFLVGWKFMENILWTWCGLIGERHHGDSSLDSLDSNHV